MTPFAIDAPDIELAIAWIWRIMCNVHARRLLKHNLSERSYRTHERALRKSPVAVRLLSDLLLATPHKHRKIYTVLKVKASVALTPKYFYNINYELHVTMPTTDEYVGCYVFPLNTAHECVRTHAASCV